MQNQESNKLSWVRLPKYSKESGDSRNAVYNRIKRNIWKRGKQYEKRGGVYWINLTGVEKWISRSK